MGVAKFGTQHVLPVVSGLEFRDQGEYVGQAEATGMPAAERSHSRTLQLMMQENAAAGVQSIVKAERWHSQGYGGSLRAAVFGVNDGLISNFGLVMGIAGTTQNRDLFCSRALRDCWPARFPWRRANMSR